MKKMLAIILMTILILALVGCGSNNDSEDDTMRLDLTIVKILREDEKVTLEMQSEDSDEVDYVVYITESTEVDVDLDTLEEGMALKVYATEIMESYPMQVNPIKVTE